MKRALAVLIAVLAILLVYPATTPSAKSPGYTDSPTNIHILPPGPAPGDQSYGNSGEEDEGDGDDLAGIKPGTRPDGGGGGTGGAFAPGYFPAGPEAKVWWMYFLRLVRIVF
jgi:hypothetical protein